ncbi:site-specific DNA-methyltransferase [Candidatus Poribacteria bacterium]|nr:site-specific DNA-methyltransferase [Candidatus Poribacteria bacterium]MYG05874.1 site-specific DNA-methyltransferase [Candidatus Poribacteria bacterium]MYK21441.1 site-specific DNA-methyltransferase [Candidatus Poribacteria bacterium]
MNNSFSENCIVLHENCTTALDSSNFATKVDLSFLDPPFNQDKAYNAWDDNMPPEKYWEWMRDICAKVYALTSDGGAIYFMQREKNTEFVLRCLRDAGWTFQNLIIWKKKTSAVPGVKRFGKHYQVIAFATKGKTPRVFHRLRIDPPLPAGYKHARENGMFVTDVWDDIRELTSGYFAGDEALRDTDGNRLHKQQAPIQLLLRIILSSTNPGDVVLDPFAGSGTTLVVAEQLGRKSIGIELDSQNVALIENRLAEGKESDDISRFFKDYVCTPDLEAIWGECRLNRKFASSDEPTAEQLALLESNVNK